MSRNGDDEFPRDANGILTHSDIAGYAERDHGWPLTKGVSCVRPECYSAITDATHASTAMARERDWPWTAPKITSGNTHGGMPSFSFLPKAQRWQLVMHLRALGRDWSQFPDHPNPDSGR